MRKVALGRQSFSFIREGNFFYVDKTRMIEDWYQSGDEVTLITRPRRFGKTLMLDTIRCFFSTEYAGRSDLFRGLAIEKNPQLMCLQGTLPVIHLSFASEKPDSFEGFLSMLALHISRLYGKHYYLTDQPLFRPDEMELFDQYVRLPFILPELASQEKSDSLPYKNLIEKMQISLLALCDWMERYYGKKVILLIDEYDTPLQSAYLYHYWPDAIKLMSGFYGMTLKTNPHLDHALLSGITRIAKESLFSDLNHLTISSVLSQEYATYYGFTEDEMDQILEEYNLTSRREEIRNWYDGFTMGKAAHIYNPWSICSFLRTTDHPIISYWAQSGGMQLVDHLMRTGKPELLRDLNALILGQPVACQLSDVIIYPNLQRNTDAIWSLLLASGYVRLASAEEAQTLQLIAGQRAIILTNAEMRESFEELAKNWLLTGGTNDTHAFASALQRHDLRGMQKALDEVVTYCASSFDLGSKPSKSSARTQPEKYFQGLMTGLTASLLPQFIVLSNDPSGNGRYDLSLQSRLEPRWVAIFEFKVFDSHQDKTISDTAARAAKQIRDLHYDARFLHEGISPDMIYAYGVAFKGKHVRLIEA